MGVVYKIFGFIFYKVEFLGVFGYRYSVLVGSKKIRLFFFLEKK